MIKAEDLKRHPEDDRVVIINSMEDFNLWEHRKALGFKAVLLPKAFSEEECDFIAKDIVRATQQKAETPDNVTEAFEETSYKAIMKPVGEYTPEGLQKDHNFAPLTVEKIEKCADLFKRLAEKKRFSVDNIHIRTNSTHPHYPHTHGVSVAAVFSGTGTRFVKPDYEFTGENLDENGHEKVPDPQYIYTVNAGDLMMFEDIWHIAGQLPENKSSPPRTQLLI